MSFLILMDKFFFLSVLRVLYQQYLYFICSLIYVVKIFPSFLVVFDLTFYHAEKIISYSHLSI